MRVDLIVVDGENDFCARGTEPENWPWPKGGRRSGALFVEGADVEAQAVANMIKRLKNPKLSNGHSFQKVHATIDSHPLNDCSHHTSWKDASGATPPPFTIVTNADVRAHKYVPRFAMGVWNGKAIPSYDWALKYTEALENGGRSLLCLWPVHCQIGTWGQAVYQPLQEAYDEWCQITGGWVNFITKGDWPWTEHYSALQADVPDPTQPQTQLNVAAINDVMNADNIAWVGWAGSHCLRWTAMDAINHFGQGDNEFVKKCVFFSDASAAVPNPPFPGAPDFAKWRTDFLDEVQNRGAKVMKTTEFLA
jgi:nicotinamidase-related amidase